MSEEMTGPPRRAASKRPASGATTAYLVLYNTVSALLRTVVLARTVQLWFAGGNAAVWDQLNLFARAVETLTAIEVVHASIRLVPAAPLTTALQVAGRNTVIWAITRNYPNVSAREPAYFLLQVAWNAADAVRYTYFAVDRAAGGVPGPLLWLRYNIFLVLYPIGFLSEIRLVYAVIEPSKSRNPLYQYLLWLGLSIYPIAFYILFGHMLSQRKKSKRKSTKKDS
ncbi:PTPLA-domain-containing protein [Thozetella sp. PMI_491]|nr:PTPLA-domain-containing protein [Thozetella sp. PMI_491]